MRKLIFAASLILGLGVSGAEASTIDYSQIGTVNGATYSFTATTDGDIVAYFYDSTAAYTERLGLLINGKSTGRIGLNNQSSHAGKSIDLGYAKAGDVLTFVDYIADSHEDFYSDTALNWDHITHVYVTDFDGNKQIPAGALIAFEDLSNHASDFDYNDLMVVVTNVTWVDPPATPVPEPAPLALLGGGLLALAALRLRKFRS